MNLNLKSKIIFANFFLAFTPCLASEKFVPENKPFDYKSEYATTLTKLYTQYLPDQIPDEDCAQLPPMRSVSRRITGKFYEVANKLLNKIKDLDQKFLALNPRYKRFHQVIYNLGLQAKRNEEATRKWLDMNKCLSKFNKTVTLRTIPVVDTLGINNKLCGAQTDRSPSLKCNPNDKYRRIDGKCNHLMNNNWGAAQHCQRRLLPPDFNDGVSRLRLSKDGSPLPNARLITTQLFREVPQLSDTTLLTTMFGQFIAHDTFSRILYLGGGLKCCDANRTHEECIQIEDIPQDKLAKNYNQKCLSVVRTVPCNTCRLGARDHLNKVTSLLDLSHVYGFNETLTKKLRTFKGGKLQMGKAMDGSNILPNASIPGDSDTADFDLCQPPADRRHLTCFRNGDGIRGNQNPAATSLVILMVRRHNQHCARLSKVNPHWDDERLFQEARRLLIAEYNRIVFGEYLPIILDKRLMKHFGLNLQRNGSTEYNPKVDPSGILSVGGAALRFGHMTTRTKFQVPVMPMYESYGYRLRDKFFETSDIWDGMTNEIIKGLMDVPEKKVGPHMVEDLQNNLFMNKCSPQISDQGATNIMRGRDYGLPAYIYYLQYITGVQIRGWNDLRQFIPDKHLMKLRTIYRDYRDIDLFVGGVLESDIKSYTFRYLIALQSYHWKFGDRFYFEHSGQAGSFNQAQLNNIRNRASMANLLCRTTDFETIPLNPFHFNQENNPRLFCRELKDIDYRLFRE